MGQSTSSRDGDARPHAGLRTCVGCRSRDERAALLRVVAGAEGPEYPVLPDPRGIAPGRGAWVHPVRTCVDNAIRRRAFARALRQPGRVDSQILSDWIEERHDAAGQTTPTRTESGFDADEHPMSTQQ